MDSLTSLVCVHPFFSMLVFTTIGFLLRGMRRIDIKAIHINIRELESALKNNDMEQAQHWLQKLKSGFGLLD